MAPAIEHHGDYYQIWSFYGDTQFIELIIKLSVLYFWNKQNSFPVFFKVWRRVAVTLSSELFFKSKGMSDVR